MKLSRKKGSPKKEKSQSKCSKSEEKDVLLDWADLKLSNIILIAAKFFPNIFFPNQVILEASNTFLLYCYVNIFVSFH